MLTTDSALAAEGSFPIRTEFFRSLFSPLSYAFQDLEPRLYAVRIWTELPASAAAAARMR